MDAESGADRSEIDGRVLWVPAVLVEVRHEVVVAVGADGTGVLVNGFAFSGARGWAGASD
jgi:hypothetical protein